MNTKLNTKEEWAAIDRQLQHADRLRNRDARRARNKDRFVWIMIGVMIGAVLTVGLYLVFTRVFLSGRPGQGAFFFAKFLSEPYFS